MSNVNWSETTLVVTGATRGIGRAVVEEASRRGAAVGAIARSMPQLEELRDGLGSGARVEVAGADVAQRRQLAEAIDRLVDRLGPVDVLVNNAGVGLYGPVLGLDPDQAERLMRTNYLGVLNATLAVLPAMARRGRGHLVNVASIAGRLGAPFEAAYSASKFAVVGFSEALAVEASAFGVRVSTVDPGPVATSFFEARGHPYQRRRPRPVTAEQVARAILEVVERGQWQRTVPASLRFAEVVRHLVPRLYLVGTRLAFRRELGELRARTREA
ncbi:MAG TPA: SDR family NAD(P)-dependent oxidoreductase [Acidimicrobiales bacterium]|nr:SDR family NAD(P)-dependent oxidoreductase [Acidimicrobiales bacterium]